ncbi:MAG: XRE family transcriptional regulator [Clostridia bacterium]|nr:XRE family transcriptional regulator [Clostridia bacterium]
MSLIRDLRLNKNMTQSELAEICGVHQTAVSQWEKGRTLPDMQTLGKLSDIFGVSVDTLIGKKALDRRNTIPILGEVKAGLPTEAVENILGYEEISDEIAANGDHFALRVKGDSMSPRILPGDIVIVRRQDYIESGEVAVVLVNNMDATVKKVIKKGTSITLVPFNSSYDPIVFTAEEVVSLPVIILGKVVELRGKF